MRKELLILILLTSFVLLTACNSGQGKEESAATTIQSTAPASTATVQPTTAAQEQTISEAATQVTEGTTALQKETEIQNTASEEQTATLQMTIGDTPVSVAWEDNGAVESLRELCRNQPLTIQMSMYGGFEQVGSLGTNLPRNDAQTTTSAGDIVLYSGNQMVVFYGSNTWAYTRLGKITDKSQAELNDLLSNGDVTINITIK